MFTDVKGFTERVSKGKREDLKHLLSVHERLLAPVIRHYEGTVVKTIGDSFLARFDSSTEAVLCGVTIQEVLRQHNARAPEGERLEVRVAVNAGDVELIDGDVMGETVNLAARLEGIAESGEVYFTESVYLAMNRSEAPSTEIGERTFAGIPYSVRVYRVIQDPNSELARRLATGVHLTSQGPLFHGLHEPQTEARHKWRKWGIMASAVAIIVGAAWLFRTMRHQPGHKEAAIPQANTAAPQTPPQRPEAPADKRPVEKPRPQAALATRRQQLDHVLQSQGAASALEWLRKQLDQSPEFEPLRGEIPTLDAMAAADSIIQEKPDYGPMVESVTALLSRYARSADVPLKLAGALEGKVRPASYPLELYKIAIERGADPHNPRIFQLSVRLFSSQWPGHLETAHDLLQRHFGDEAAAWARRALNEEPSGVVLENAWTILRRRKDPIVNDPYYKCLYRLIAGYGNEEEADHDLAVFRRVTDVRQQQHILAVHRWVLKPLEEKGVSSSGYSHRELAERNLAELEELWKGPK
jgi:class 3 adenylate cyclase